MKDVVDLIGRVFISLIFFWEAYDSISYFDAVKRTMSLYSITWNQDFLLYTTIVILILGAFMVLVGYKSAFGAFLLLLYWVPVTFMVYSFWNDPVSERRITSILFMKNVAIIGGLLIILARGSGRFSIKRMIKASKPPKAKWD